MLKYKTMPVIWVGDLENALKERYGENFLSWDDNLRNILFDDDYCNDVAKQLYILDIEEWEDWFAEFEDKRRFDIKNQVKLFLQTIFPNEESVMIDIMW